LAEKPRLRSGARHDRAEGETVPKDEAPEAKKPRRASASTKKAEDAAPAPKKDDATTATAASAATETEAAGAAEAAPRPSWIRRAGRAVVKPVVLWSAVAALVVAGNAWMYVLVQGWRAEDETLRDEIRASAESVAQSDAAIAYHSSMLDLIDSQTQAAEDWTTSTEASRDEEVAIADGYKEVVLDYITCSNERSAAIKTAWANGNDAAHKAAASKACSAAAAKLKTLKGGE
jgi:hypothetical protein